MQLWRTTADVRDDVVDALGDDDAVDAVGAIVKRRRGRRRDRDGHGRTRHVSPSDVIVVHQITRERPKARARRCRWTTTQLSR